jgi:hypothetical protein
MLLQETTSLAVKDFSLELKGLPSSREELVQALGRRIEYMLEHEAERLFSTLYLLDVDEKAVREVLFSGKYENPPLSVSELIIGRLQKKAETRLQWRKPPQGDEDW